MLPCVRLGTRGVWTLMAIQPCAIISTLRLQASLEVLAGRLKDKKVAIPPCGSDGGTRCVLPTCGGAQGRLQMLRCKILCRQ
jgi:hypothetical protein